MKTLLFTILSMILLTPKPTSQVAVTKDGTQVQCIIDPTDIKIHTDPAFSSLVPVWQEFLDSGNMHFVLDGADSASKAVIDFSVDPVMDAEEYSLDMDNRHIKVRASSAAGAWWAMQTITQLMVGASKDADGKVVIPAYSIDDKPAFAYRGAHLDCCRHFFTKDEVKRFIDMMCIHKLNVFHWHLTDDQGWRMEIKKYPLLTEVGSIRRQTLVGHAHNRPEVYDGTPYGESMYYTQDDCREIVAYAAARQVRVIPEIEMPGHMVAALTAYPYLGCTGGPYEVWPKWGISDDVLCLGKETSYEFIEDVLSEVCEVFPDEYIHIGGDEAPVKRRVSCPHCQAKMKELGLEKEVQLQGHLIARAEKFLAARGCRLIGWDEILDAGISDKATVMSWRGSKGGIKAARMGNQVVMTPNSHFYLDYYQTTDPEANHEPLAIGGKLPLSKCYSFDPYDQLDDSQKQAIIGIQANTWTEYIATFDHVVHMDLPRFSALSEVCWNHKKDSYEVFFERMKASLLPVYDNFHYIYASYEFNRSE